MPGPQDCLQARDLESAHVSTSSHPSSVQSGTGLWISPPTRASDSPPLLCSRSPSPRHLPPGLAAATQLDTGHGPSLVSQRSWQRVRVTSPAQAGTLRWLQETPKSHSCLHREAHRADLASHPAHSCPPLAPSPAPPVLGRTAAPFPVFGPLFPAPASQLRSASKPPFEVHAKPS